MRTYTCTTCGASLATSAAPGTTIDCQYCNTPFLAPAPSLDQPGDSQATVTANFTRRGNPSPMPPVGPDGTPPSTPDLPPAPDSPAGVGYTVDAEAGQSLVEPGLGDPVADSPVAASGEAVLAAAAGPASTPELTPEPTGPPEALHIPELAADQPTPIDLGPPEPVEEPPVAPDLGTPAEEPAPVEPTASELSAPEAEPSGDEPPASAVSAPPPAPSDATRFPAGAAIPAELRGLVAEPVNVAPAPPAPPLPSGPPSAPANAPASTPARPANANRTPMLIGGGVLLLCCVLCACVSIVVVLPFLLALLSGGS